jgi:hypothetical protein
MRRRYTSTISRLSDNTVSFDQLFKLIPKKIMLLLILTLFTVTDYAQEYRAGASQTDLLQSQKIMHVDQLIESLRATSKNIDSNPLRIESLTKDVQPSIYVSSQDVKTYGDKPTCLFIDIKSLNTVNLSNLLINDIEIITIKINNTQDLSSMIDLSKFSNFPKLKYIYILSTVKSPKDEIIRLIKNNNPKYDVFYNILKTS